LKPAPARANPFVDTFVHTFVDTFVHTFVAPFVAPSIEIFVAPSPFPRLIRSSRHDRRSPLRVAIGRGIILFPEGKTDNSPML
jgi:hypothetical protein